MRKPVCILGLTAILAAGCSQSVEVTSVYGPGVRFSDSAHTYAWAPGSSRTSGDGRPANPNVDKLLRQFIDAHLARKGYEQASSNAKPDFWIDYTVKRSLRAEAADFNRTVHQIGRLEVVVQEPATSKLIWKGSAETELDDSVPPDAIKTRLDTIISKLIDQAPSTKKS